MPLESASFITGLNEAYPRASDFSSQGDDHIRLLKFVLRNTLPNLDGRVNMSADKLNTLDTHLSTVEDGSTLGLKVTGQATNAIDIADNNVTIQFPLILTEDPTTTTAVGNVGYNDLRYYVRQSANGSDQNSTYSASQVDALVKTLTDLINALSDHTASTGNPSGGKSGDVWIKTT